MGEDAQYFHYGLTSSDVVDTAFALQLKASGALILDEIKGLAKALKKLQHPSRARKLKGYTEII